MPIVTTFDPDGVIRRHGLGLVANTVDELAAQIRSLPRSDAYKTISDAARKYYMDNQTVEAVSRRFRAAFDEMLSSQTLASADLNGAPASRLLTSRTR